MFPTPPIFISAVSRELKSGRQIVANTLTSLGYQPYWQDVFGTESGDVRAMLRRQIDQCKGVIQLVGQSYGLEPPAPDEEFGRVSYTQYEALYARQRGKKVWYLFIDETFPADPHAPEPEELRDLQAAYRRSLQSGSQLFHSATSKEALEASVFKLRNNLTRVRRGAKRWAGGVIVLLVCVLIAVVWLVQAYSRDIGAFRKALVRLAEVQAGARQPGGKLSQAEQRANAYTFLEKELALPAGTLAKELPPYALKLYNSIGAPFITRARAAYALGRFDEAEKLSLEGVAQERRIQESARRMEVEGGDRMVEAFQLAGHSAQERIEYAAALEHFRAAEKLTDRERNPENWADVQFAIADVLYEQGQYSSAENILRRVLEMRTQLLGAEDLETLRSRNRLYYTLWRQAKNTEAASGFLDLLRLEEEILGFEHPDTLSTRNGLANVYVEQSKYADGETAHRLNLKIKQKIFGPAHPETLKTRNNLIGVLAAEGKDAEAEAEVRDIIRIQEKVLGSEHPDTLLSRINLVGTLGVQGKYAEAEAQCRELLEIQIRVLGANHPHTLLSRNTLGSVLGEEGKYTEAEALYRELIKVQTDTFSSEHPTVLDSRNNLATVLGLQGRYDEAEALCHELIAIEERALGRDHPVTLWIRHTFVNVLVERKRYHEAETEGRSLIDATNKLFGPKHRRTLLARTTFGTVLDGLGRYDEAEALYRDIIAIEEEVLGQEHSGTLDSYYCLACTLKHKNMLEESRAFAERAALGSRKVLGPSHPSTRKYEKLWEQLKPGT